MSAITWLHLSDLHLSADQHEGWQQNVVLQALLEDLRDPAGGGKVKPDFAVVTGDIANRGTPQEYALAASFFDDLLHTLNLSKSQLFMVPGNHDINRDRVTNGAKTLAASLNGPDAVSRLLRSAPDRRLVLARLDDYVAFVRRYFKGHQTFPQKQFHFVRLLDLAGLRVAILGLNSAWLAYGGPADSLRLGLGELQVRQALEASRHADVRIALVHHPFEWLMEAERQRCEPLLMEACDFVLSGHLHHANLLRVGTPDAEASLISAGAAYETPSYRNSYNLVTVDPDTQRATVHLRTYTPAQGGFWTADVQRYKRVKDGTFTFNVPLPRCPGLHGAYELQAKHLHYEYLSDRRMVQVKRHTVRATADGVSLFRDRYKWSGYGRCTPVLTSGGAELLGPEASSEDTSAEGGAPWYLYQVRFHAPLAKGQVRDVEVRWDMDDQAGTARPYYATTINVPTALLTMRVVFYREPSAVRGLIIPPDPATDFTEATDLVIDAKTRTISWRVDNPQLWHRYLILWQ